MSTASLHSSAVPAVIEKQLGRRPTRIKLIPTLEDDLVYAVSLPRGSVIFKAVLGGMGGRIALEAWACERVRRAGVPAPEILAVDMSRRDFPGSYLIQERVAGTPLSRVGQKRRREWKSLSQAGGYLRRIHGITLKRFGWLDGTLYLRRGRAEGRYQRWSDAALRPLSRRLAYLKQHRLLDRRSIQSIHDAIEEHRDVFRGISRGRLLHGDLGSSHIFVDPHNGKVTGIVDFGDVQAGDPLWDLAWFSVWRHQEDVRDLIAGYGLDRSELDKAGRTFTLYVLLQAVGDVVWLHERQLEIRPRLTVIRNSLAALKEGRYRTPV